MSFILRRNNVRVLGHGTQSMVFAHGFGCDQNMWRWLTPAFEDCYKVVLFDYAGHGGSDRTFCHAERYGRLEGYVQDVLEICGVLGLEKTIFVGHSVSSIVGILAAIEEPERFETLILVAPSPCYLNDPPEYMGGFEVEELEALLQMMDKNYIGWADVLSATVMKNSDRPELAQELQKSFCSTDPVIARRFARATFFSDNRGDLPRLNIPSLIMQCSEDSIAPLTVGDYMRRHLRDSTLRVMDATGHCPHMSHPAETIRLMQEYLVTARR